MKNILILWRWMNWLKCILYSCWLSCFVQNCPMIYLRRHKNCRLKQTLTYVSISQRIKTKSFHEKTKLLAFYLRCKSLFLNMSNKCHINNIFFFLSWLTVKVREETLPILRITKTSLWVTNICRAKIILNRYLIIEVNVFIIDHDKMFYNTKICLNVTKKGKFIEFCQCPNF